MAWHAKSSAKVFCIILAILLFGMTIIDRLSPLLLPTSAFYSRPWEHMVGAFGYFIPKKNAQMNLPSYGDLAIMLGVPEYGILRPMMYTNDAFGYRNSPETQHQNPDVIVVGDSFFAGVADTDDDTFISQLQRRTDVKVTAYAPADMPVFLADRDFQDTTAKTVVWGRTERLLTGRTSEMHALLADSTCFQESHHWRDRLKRRMEETLQGPAEYAQMSIIHRLSLRVYKPIFFAAAGKPHGPVLISHDDSKMLYLLDGARMLHATSDDREYDKVIAAIKHVRDCLADRGITLIMMLAPDKEHIYPEGIPPPYFRDLLLSPDPLEELMTMIQSEGIPVVSPLKAFQDHRARSGALLYWKDDTHWNALGMKIAVDELLSILESTAER